MEGRAYPEGEVPSGVWALLWGQFSVEPSGVGVLGSATVNESDRQILGRQESARA